MTGPIPDALCDLVLDPFPTRVVFADQDDRDAGALMTMTSPPPGRPGSASNRCVDLVAPVFACMAASRCRMGFVGARGGVRSKKWSIFRPL